MDVRLFERFTSSADEARVGAEVAGGSGRGGVRGTLAAQSGSGRGSGTEGREVCAGFLVTASLEQWCPVWGPAQAWVLRGELWDP